MNEVPATPTHGAPAAVPPPAAVPGKVPDAARHRHLHRVSNAAARLGALAVVYLLFALIVPADKGFVSDANTQLMLQDICVVSMAAIGATVIIIAGGIDLSVGSAIAFAMISCAYILNLGPHNDKLVVLHPVAMPLLAVLASVTAALLIGLLNGVLVTTLRLVPFIVTLGTMQMARGLAKFVAREQNIYSPDAVRELWIAKLLEPSKTLFSFPFLPVGVWMVVLAATVATLFLRYTRPGRHIFAIGSNERTARLCGVPVGRTKVLVYVIGGFFSGLAGMLFFARLGAVGQPTEAAGYELFVIAAAVVGGASLLGGRGSVYGTMAGALIITVLRNGGVKMGWPQYVQEFVTGAVIIIAVAVDNLRHGQKN